MEKYLKNGTWKQNLISSLQSPFLAYDKCVEAISILKRTWRTARVIKQKQVLRVITHLNWLNHQNGLTAAIELSINLGVLWRLWGYKGSTRLVKIRLLCLPANLFHQIINITTPKKKLWFQQKSLTQCNHVGRRQIKNKSSSSSRDAPIFCKYLPSPSQFHVYLQNMVRVLWT